MYEGKHPALGSIIVDLDGGWTVNHYGGSEGYLGWLVLQPRAHKKEFTRLSKKELQSLGENIKRTEISLRNYWELKFPDDLIQRVYVVYFFEYDSVSVKPKDYHLHIHLIPRTKRLYPLLKEGSKTVAWRIYKVHDDPRFPLEYKKNKSNVQRLMQYLKHTLR